MKTDTKYIDLEKKRVTTKNFKQLRLDIHGFDGDLLTAILFDNGCLGIEEIMKQIWLVYFDEKFSPGNISALAKLLKKINPEFQSRQMTISRLDNRDWNAEWKSHYQPIKIGGRLWVAPPWSIPHLNSDDILIRIDPQMAFGTGSHETTQLVIYAADKYLKEGEKVLDAGTGSGILALAVKKFGAGTVIAFDIEKDAIENARHNLQLNQINDVDFRFGGIDIIPESEFDLILANINRNVLVDLMPGLAKKTKLNGHLVVSGILKNDKSFIEKTLPGSLSAVDISEKGEWISIVFKKDCNT